MRSLFPLSCALVAGCSPLIRAALDHAPVPRRSAPHVCSGDLHFHVQPPDGDPTRMDDPLDRTFDETVALLKSAGLDFVAITPHLWTDELDDDHVLTSIADAHSRLREALRSDPHAPLLFRGVELSDPAFGHLGVIQLDADAPFLDGTARDPLTFLEHATTARAFLVAYHPLQIGGDVPMPWARVDLSWRALTHPVDLPPWAVFADAHLSAYEAYNLPVAELSDRFLHLDATASLRRVLAVVDDHTRKGGGPAIAVGGSDSHRRMIRATTFVIAPACDAAHVREGLVSGAVCVRSPEPCGLRASADDVETSVGVGGLLRARQRVLISSPQRATFLWDGHVLNRSPATSWVEPIADDACHVLRAEAGAGFSNGIKVNCR